MVPSPSAGYFPSLDKCLARELPLLSWASAYSAVTALDSVAAPPALDTFLADDTVLRILSAPLSPFATPSQQSKNDFDTKTAAINVSPSADGHYDIEEIKKHALWLSKEAGIEETQALRLVLVDWQQTSSSRLVAEWSDDERLGLQNAQANAHFRQSVTSLGHQQDKASFDNEDQTRARLLNLLYAETSSIFALSALLIGLAQPEDLQPIRTNNPRSPLQKAATFIWDAQRNSGPAFFLQCIDTIKSMLQTLGDTSKWPEFVSQHDEVAHAFVKAIFTQLVPLLRLAYLHIFTIQDVTDPRLVSAWYSLMDETVFFLTLPDFPETQDLIIVIRCLTSLISVEILKSKPILDLLNPSTTTEDDVVYPQLPQACYLYDDECIRTVTATLYGAAQAADGIRHAGPPILAWSIIAQILRSFVSDKADEDEASTPVATSRYQECLDLMMYVRSDPNDDPIALMAKVAVADLETFEMTTSLSECLLLAFGSSYDLHVAACGKMTLFHLLGVGYRLFQYGPDLVQAVLSIISYDTVPPSLSRTRARNPVQPVKAFLDDTRDMGTLFFNQIQSRYPYELRPFLTCLLSISQSRASRNGQDSQVLEILENMTTFTHILPQIYVEKNLYQNYREDELQNHIQLLADLPIIAPRSQRARQLRLISGSQVNQAQLDPTIQDGTVGIVLTAQQKPIVVCWHHEHSALEHLGILLSTRLSNASLIDAINREPLDKEAAAEIIALTDSLIYASVADGDHQTAKALLGRLSSGLDRNDDIVRVIFQIFEEELHSQVEQPGTEGSLYLLVHCVRLMQTLLRIYPERIWSLLTRSRLLSVDDSVGGLAAIVSATELPLGQYDLLRACVGLFEGLIEDSVTRAVSRKSTVKTITRWTDGPTDISHSTPEKLMSAVLGAFQRILLDVLQSSPSWRFVFPSERCEVNTRILNAVTEILVRAYSTDDSEKVSVKLTGVFAQPAEDILNVFLAEKPHALTFHPILNILMSALASVNPGPLENEESVRSQTCAALSFCSTVLNVGLLIDRRGVYLTKNLLQAMPLLARLFAAQHHYKAPIASVLTSIVRTVNYSEAEPASLLGHLSPEAAKCFLTVLSDLDYPLQDIDVEASIWDTLSAVVSNKQQWLAICLLTGSTPRDRLKGPEKQGTVVQNKALLKHALDQLSNIKMISPKLAIAMLQFVALSQDHWAWATHGIGRHTDFLKSCADWLSELRPIEKTAGLEADTRMANENQMAAFAADIVARYLHNARQLGDVSTAKSIATKLGYLRDHGVAVDAYKHSLHITLAKNFAAKFPQCTLENFKRTALLQQEYGRDYYYDRKIASQMLDFDSSWGKSRGYAEEFAIANVNLSLVDSQVNLLKSWKALAIMLGTFAEDVPSLQKDLAMVTRKCLLANVEASIPNALFDNVAQIRADMAFVLLQRLTLIKSKEAEVRGLIAPAWDIVRTATEDFEVAATPQEVNYYRTLLRVLFLALQPQIYNPAPIAVEKRSKASTVVPIPIEMLGAVHNNFRALCSNVHADAESVEPADFVLLTALLQSILRVPGISSAHSSIAAAFADSGTIRYATSLYSWSDRLASDSGDPIYGELAILFLLELSSVPMLAEQMAIEGVLARLSSANLSHYLRNANGKGPFDEPIRVFSIWTKGLLPLCLNLLEAVGPPIAAEIGAFVNSFPAQLRRAETALENRQPTLRHPYAGCITLGLASETHSLSLVSLILERLKAVGASSGVMASEIPVLDFDKAVVKEGLEAVLRNRRALRERIMPVGEREAEWAKRKPQRQDSENFLEEKILGELEAALVCLTG